MARINLLPWREKQRKQKQVQFIAVLVIMMFLTGISMFGVHLFQEDRIDYQNKRLAYIQKKIRQLDNKILQIKMIDLTRKNLEKRIQKVRDLESNRAEVVHLFHEIAERLPKGVYLTTIGQSKDRLTLQGIAQDNNDISNYIHNLEKSLWLDHLGLDVIKNRSARTKSEQLSLFILTAQQSQPDKKNKVGKKGKNSVKVTKK